MSDSYRTEWHHHNLAWGSLGYPKVTYEEYLESEVKHWRKCAGARYADGARVYSEDDIIHNLQERVNQLEAENRDLRKRLEVNGEES